ncbi:VOC family protein [Paeniglutamicibacter sp. NPDC091659]|uniref:VOC family protein n=1 Tax=Paeniglutamicibacter sp. NPDC091659 TaxID=3364389 RepID=UPI00382C41FB
MSLSSSPLTTIIPVTDGERSRHFYEDTLGLPFQGQATDGNMVFTLAGSGALALLSDPDAKPSPHTTASFEVRDIAGVITELGAKGVVFEEYDLPDLKTVDHVCVLGSEKAAWFKDPDGNILCLHENLT